MPHTSGAAAAGFSSLTALTVISGALLASGLAGSPTSLVALVLFGAASLGEFLMDSTWDLDATGGAGAVDASANEEPGG